jgi:prepilin-type N-terminal cleavage/methylation domain-containing protein
MAKLYYEKGFTLLEVLVAITILSIGLLGVASLTTGIIKGNLYSKNVTSATVVAQQTIEEIQRVGYASANTLVGTATMSMGGFTFTRVTTISDATPAANMKTAKVTVSWNPGGYSISLDTIISQ